jgi:hypothetical protein
MDEPKPMTTAQVDEAMQRAIAANENATPSESLPDQPTDDGADAAADEGE